MKKEFANEREAKNYVLNKLIDEEVYEHLKHGEAIERIVQSIAPSLRPQYNKDEQWAAAEHIDTYLEIVPDGLNDLKASPVFGVVSTAPGEPEVSPNPILLNRKSFDMEDEAIIFLHEELKAIGVKTTEGFARAVNVITTCIPEGLRSEFHRLDIVAAAQVYEYVLETKEHILDIEFDEPNAGRVFPKML